MVLRRFLGAEDLEHLARDHKEALDTQYPPERKDGSERLWTRMFDESTPFAASLMEDLRFLKPAQKICGDGVLGIGTDVNRYVGDTGWHPDTGDERQIAVKYIFYLDPVDASTGALRVIPGSHLLRGAERKAISAPGTLHSAVAITAGPGISIISAIPNRMMKSNSSARWAWRTPVRSCTSNTGASTPTRALARQPAREPGATALDRSL